MERILARLRTKSDEFQGGDHDRRETLALVILRATKASTTEPKLLALARKTAKTF